MRVEQIWLHLSSRLWHRNSRPTGLKCAHDPFSRKVRPSYRGARDFDRLRSPDLVGRSDSFGIWRHWLCALDRKI